MDQTYHNPSEQATRAQRLWSYLMFGRHEIGFALLDIGALWLAIGAFILAAGSVSQTAARLFLPYLAWVTFAAALNVEVWRLNP